MDAFDHNGFCLEINFVRNELKNIEGLSFFFFILITTGTIMPK